MTAPPVAHADKLPPHWSEWVLRTSLAEHDRAAVLGDLQEEFAALSSTIGSAAARRWYRIQVARSLWPTLWRRLASRFRSQDPAQSINGAWVLAVLFAGMTGPFALFLWALSGDWEFLAVVAATSVFLGVWLTLTWFVVRLWPRRPDGSVRTWNPSVHRLLVFWMLAFLDDSHLFAYRGSWLGRWWLLFLRLVILVWPSRTKPAATPEYVVRTPVLGYRDRSGSAFQTIGIPTVPVTMSPVILGLPAERLIAADDASIGIEPMTVTLERAFTPDTVLRLFATMTLGARRTIDARLLVRREDGTTAQRVDVPVRQTPVLDPNVLSWASRLMSTSGKLSKRTGPDPNAVAIDASLPLADFQPGRYTLRLVAEDGALTSHQDVEIAIIRQAHAVTEAKALTRGVDV